MAIQDVLKQTAENVLVYYLLSLYICLLLIEVSAATVGKLVSQGKERGHFSNEISGFD